MIEDTKENGEKCACKNCPSKNECMKENKEWLYCARDKSNCKVEQKGCMCGACPVATENKLNEYYYCIRGKA